MDQLTITGKTVEEAIEKGLEKLGITRDLAEIEVLDEPSSGLFGIIGGKPAQVKVAKKYDPGKLCCDYLEALLDKMKIPAMVEVQEEKNNEREIFLDIKGKRLGTVIGKRGQTLNALQLLVNIYLSQKLKGSNYYVILDAEDYRDKRKETLEKLANNLAKKVLRTKKQVILEPMNRYERKIIHTALQDDEYVKTYSEGKEPNRKVVIDLK